jgi:putative SOS response-associated peptidase YedK
VPYKNKADRKYTNAAKYEAQPEQVKNRVARNAARSKLMKAGKVSKGDGKDVAHVKAFDKGGANKNGVRVESAAKNRSFKRDSKRNLVSETSTRERKKK